MHGLALAVACILPASAQADSCLNPKSWVAGTTDLCSGTIVYHDYLYDDYGANQGQLFANGSLAPSAGADTNQTDINSADLVSLQLRLVRHRLLIRAVLNDLVTPRSTLLGITIGDGDGDDRGGNWAPLQVASRGWDKLIVLRSGAPGNPVITGSVPAPPGPTWQIQAATALASTGKVLNVAFRGPDEQARFIDKSDLSGGGLWFEDDQAAALKSGDISQFAFTVRTADLRHHATRIAPVGPGLHERVYTSRFVIPPGGYNTTGVPGRGQEHYTLLGRYLPYAIYIPHHPGPFGLQFVYHGNSSNFPALINQPGMEKVFSEDLDRILVGPSDRGPFGWSDDYSERDELDVLADVERSYPIDRSRVFASGYSSGGFVAQRIAAMFPQLFAGVVTWSSAPNNEVGAGPVTNASAPTNDASIPDILGNLRRVPAALLYSGGDEIQPLPDSLPLEQAYAASDDIFTFYLHPAGEHLTYALLDDWRKEAAYTMNLTIVQDPPRVTYRTETYLDSPKLGIAHDRAYWVSAIRGRQTGHAWESVDLTSQACGGSVPRTATGNGAGTDPVPWVSFYREQIGLRALPLATRLTGTLSNVASLRIDARATCLTDRTFAYDITTDGPALIRLSDGRKLRLIAAGEHRGALPKDARR